MIRIVSEVHRVECDLCPKVDVEHVEHGTAPRLPAGWSWCVPPRSYLPDVHRTASQLGGHPTYVIMCPTCTKRVEDATRPCPEKRR